MTQTANTNNLLTERENIQPRSCCIDRAIARSIQQDLALGWIFIIYRPGARGIRRNISRSDDIFRGAFVIFPEVMIFSEGLCPEENIITEGNITPNPPSEGSINDINYTETC